MHGLVWEWCQDNWHDSYQGAPTDGSAWVLGTSNYYVIRGGSWFNDPNSCRSAVRSSPTRVGRYYGVGFRVVCVAPSTLQGQSWQMGICRACVRGVQTCSCDVE